MTKMELERVLEWMPKTGKTAAGMTRIIRERDLWPEGSQEKKVLKQFVGIFERTSPDMDVWVRFFDEMVQWMYIPDKLRLLVFEESRVQILSGIKPKEAAYRARAKRVFAQIREEFCPELEPWGKKADPVVPGLEDEEVR